MNILELIIISISLGMDACSVAISKGLSMKSFSFYKAIIISSYFAIFQLIMPIIGYLFGSYLGSNIKVYSHIIAFILLVILGISMIRESKNEYKDIDDDVSFKCMIIPSIATSIDALTIGITFSLLDVNIWLSSILIFIITFILSFIGVKIGNIFGIKYKGISQLLGGIILVILGIKMII